MRAEMHAKCHTHLDVWKHTDSISLIAGRSYLLRHHSLYFNTYYGKPSEQTVKLHGEMDRGKAVLSNQINSAVSKGFHNYNTTNWLFHTQSCVTALCCHFYRISHLYSQPRYWGKKPKSYNIY